MRVLVCGGRDYNDKQRVWEYLDASNECVRITRLIQGGGRGADALAKAWADDRGIPIATHEAQWEVYGRAAGPMRNQKMLMEEQPDLVIAFPGGKGTLDVVTRARKAGIAVDLLDP